MQHSCPRRMLPGRLLCLTSHKKVALLAVMQSHDGSADSHSPPVTARFCRTVGCPDTTTRLLTASVRLRLVYRDGKPFQSKRLRDLSRCLLPDSRNPGGKVKCSTVKRGKTRNTEGWPRGDRGHPIKLMIGDFIDDTAQFP